MRVRLLLEQDADGRHVGARRHDVVGHPIVLHATVLPHHVLVERPADALRHAALDLSRREQRVDDLAHLLHRPELLDAGLVRGRVDGHLRDVHRPGVRAVRVAPECAVVPGKVAGLLVRGRGPQGSSLADEARARRAERRRVVRSRQHSAREQLGLDGRGGGFDELAHDGARARSDGGAAVGDVARVGRRHLDVVAGHAQRVGGDLREDRVRALADLGARGQHAHATVRRALGADHRGQVLLAGAREAGSVQERREAHAALDRAAGRVLDGETCAARVPVARRESAVEHPAHVDLVAHHLTGGERLALADEVATAQLVGRKAEPPRDDVEVPLEREEGLGSAEPAERAVRGRVRRHGPRADAHVIHVVGPCGVDAAAREHHLREGGIGAAVDHEVDVEGDQTPLPGEKGAVARPRRVALGRRGHVLGAVVDDLHGPAALLREQGRVDADHRRVLLLAAEPAPGLVLDDARVLGRHVEELHERFLHVVRALQRTADRDAAPRVELADDPVGLDVQLLLRAREVLALEHEHVVAGGGGVHVALADPVLLEDVVGAPDDRGLRERVLDRHHRRQRLDVERHRRASPLEQGAVGVSEQDDRLLVVVDDAVGERRLVVVDEGDDVVRDVGGGHDRDRVPGNALAEADAPQACPRTPAAHRDAVDHARHHHVVDVARPAGDLRDGLLAGDGLTYGRACAHPKRMFCNGKVHRRKPGYALRAGKGAA